MGDQIQKEKTGTSSGDHIKIHRRKLLSFASMFALFPSNLLSSAARAQSEDLPHCPDVRKTISYDVGDQRWNIELTPNGHSGNGDVYVNIAVNDNSKNTCYLDTTIKPPDLSANSLKISEIRFTNKDIKILRSYLYAPTKDVIRTVFHLKIKIDETVIYNQEPDIIDREGKMDHVSIDPDLTVLGGTLRLYLNKDIRRQISAYLQKGGPAWNVSFFVIDPRRNPARNLFVGTLPSSLTIENLGVALRKIDPYASELSKAGVRTAQMVKRGECSLDAGCFVTTACCTYFGKNDDCWELSTLREFRDQWLMKQSDGNSWVELYYQTAPRIVAGIDGREDAPQIYKHLYWKYILPAAIASRLRMNVVAFQIYKGMMKRLGVRRDVAF